MNENEIFENLISNYINGNCKDFVEEFDKLKSKKDFLDYLNGEYESTNFAYELIYKYFSWKEN
jgi:hypothetical protein